MGSFAAYVTVGPSAVDERRLVDLIDSLHAYEPAVEPIVLVDNGIADRDLRAGLRPDQARAVVTVKACRQDHTMNVLGVSCVSTFTALGYLHSHADVDVVLRLDTDALVIGPFVARIREEFARRPDCGMLGALGNSCNRTTRRFWDADAESAIRHALALARQWHADRSQVDNGDIANYALFHRPQIDAFLRVCAELEPIRDNAAFTGAHCQGGAYAVPRRFIDRLAAAGYLDEPTRWSWFPLAEDRLIGACCWLLQMTVEDCSEPHEPFGVQAEGIPHSPQEIERRGYAIIHSVRTETRMTEAQIREHFASRRPRRVEAAQAAHAAGG
jgi:hypothetical protein